MGPCCGGEAEGPDGSGRRSEECLPSGREKCNQLRSANWRPVSLSPLRALTFPPCASHACRHTHCFSFSLSELHTHTHTGVKKNDTFSLSYFLCFYIPGPGVQEATLCFHVTKHTEACVDRGEVNSLIHHSGLGLSEPHLGISLSTLRKWDCWRCLPSVRELQLSLVPRLTDDFSGESKFQS